MKALILAAGRGSRMKELTENSPKCLVKLNGKSLLTYQLIALREAGITEIGIVTGYRREMLVSSELIEFYNERWDKTNMVSSLNCAYEWLQADDCIVSYSDIFYEASAVNSLIEAQADIAITYDPNWLDIWSRRFEDPLSDAETFKMNDKSELCEIGNQPKLVDQVQGQYMGLLKFTPKGLDIIARLQQGLSADLQDKMHMTGALQKVIESKVLAIKAVPYLGRWGEVDSEDDLACYQ
ncbi:phosphocholine cytidylyltransferase family protein [Paraglaciecola sp. 20A4]|uniref:phosphocholine cytidylyltransferase family protein n=1 Tax=Paraglaciecola sp. 20A4 TaxID=2687288 RepID=UPI0014092974|nr:phosphocholine cytidylyltransferase family protein [Paraglaciecola sp. 20A4]